MQSVLLRFRNTILGVTLFHYVVSIGSVLGIAVACYIFKELLGYRVVALLLLLMVSILAMTMDMMAVVVAAVISALVWNFFFIPPALTFHINAPEDILLFLMYFVVAILNAVLTSRLRIVERRVRADEENKRTIALYNTVLNSLSHELRTPIATIIGAVDTLKESGDKLSGENKAQLLDEIETAGTRLNRHVQNLLNMSRLESGSIKINTDWCDINELIHSVIHSLRDESRDHHVLFTTDESMPLFKIDRGLIEQVLFNLVFNALQYTPTGSSIRIAANQQNGSCVFTVSDQGSGFPVSELDSVFKKFYRLPNARPGGTGLGLSIAKGFTEAHQGTITLENLPGRGARFTVTIPAESSDIHPSDNEQRFDSHH